MGMADKIASLTTISTPHHGSPVANLFRKYLPLILLGSRPATVLNGLIRLVHPVPQLEFAHVLSGFGTSLFKATNAVKALTPDGANAFDALEVEERAIRSRVKKVQYRAYGGDMRADRDHFDQNAIMEPGAAILEAEGQRPNNGVVSEQSARFPWDREVVENFPFNHLCR